MKSCPAPNTVTLLGSCGFTTFPAFEQLSGYDDVMGYYDFEWAVLILMLRRLLLSVKEVFIFLLLSFQSCARSALIPGRNKE